MEQLFWQNNRNRNCRVRKVWSPPEREADKGKPRFRGESRKPRFRGESRKPRFRGESRKPPDEIGGSPTTNTI